MPECDLPDLLFCSCRRTNSHTIADPVSLALDTPLPARYPGDRSGGYLLAKRRENAQLFPGWLFSLCTLLTLGEIDPSSRLLPSAWRGWRRVVSDLLSCDDEQPE